MGVLRQARPPGWREPRIDSSVLILLPLVFGFAIAATVVFAVASALGSAAPARQGPPWSWLLPVALGVCAVLDLAFPRLRRTLFRRQTPQMLVGALPAPLGAVVWGLDTGSVLSTYRASAASWAGLLLVFAGWGPWWTGIAYAAGFGVPLALLVASYRPGPSTKARQGPLARLRTADTDASVVPALIQSARHVRMLSAVLVVAAIVATTGATT